MLKQADLEKILHLPVFKEIVRKNILNGISDIHLSPEHPKRFHGYEFIPDSQLIISLKVNGQNVAYSGLSYGLGEYYEVDSTHPKFKEKEKFIPIIESMDNKPIITEMQAVPGTLRLRDSIDWRLAFTEAWETIDKLSNQRTSHYLPKELNYWQVPSIQEQLFEHPSFRAPDSVFKTNYNNNAMRCGYSPNPEQFNIFEKKLN